MLYNIERKKLERMYGIDKVEIDVEEFYIRYGPMVLRRCRKLLKDEDKALDAMQEVFVKLLINKERLKNTFPSSLLFRIATNVCLNILRDQHNRQSTSEENVLANIAMYDESENKLIVDDLLERISGKEKPSTREIAVLHFIDGMTLKEVAAEVGLSFSGVRKRIRTLRKRINENKEEYYVS